MCECNSLAQWAMLCIYGHEAVGGSKLRLYLKKLPSNQCPSCGRSLCGSPEGQSNLPWWLREAKTMGASRDRGEKRRKRRRMRWWCIHNSQQGWSTRRSRDRNRESPLKTLQLCICLCVLAFFCINY